MFKINPNKHDWNEEMYQITSMDRIIGDDEFADTLHDITPSEVNVENEAIGHIKEECLYSCLSEKQLEIIKLRKKELSFSEIGKLQKCTGANVKYHYKQAKEKMESLREVI
jgi:DNA-directed RNA polymerase specialized sigma subunit